MCVACVHKPKAVIPVNINLGLAKETTMPAVNYPPITWEQRCEDLGGKYFTKEYAGRTLRGCEFKDMTVMEL